MPVASPHEQEEARTCTSPASFSFAHTVENPPPGWKQEGEMWERTVGLDRSG